MLISMRRLILFSIPLFNNNNSMISLDNEIRLSKILLTLTQGECEVSPLADPDRGSEVLALRQVRLRPSPAIQVHGQ